VAGDDAVNDRKAEPGPLSCHLVGERRLKNPLQRRLVEPLPVSLMARRTQSAAPDIGWLATRIAAERHRGSPRARRRSPAPRLVTMLIITGRCWLAIRRHQRTGRSSVRNSISRCNGHAQQGEGVLDEGDEIDGSFFGISRRLNARICLSEIARAPARLIDEVEALALAAVLRQLVEDELAQHDDRHQGIVEVVGDAARQGCRSASSFCDWKSCCSSRARSASIRFTSVDVPERSRPAR